MLSRVGGGRGGPSYTNKGDSSMLSVAGGAEAVPGTQLGGHSSVLSKAGRGQRRYQLHN